MDMLVISGFAVLLAVLCLLGVLNGRFLGKEKIRRNGKPLKRPPDSLPLVGNGLRFLQARHKLFSWFVDCEQLFSYETFEISVPSLPAGVVINDPQNLEFVFKNDGIFVKGDFVKARSWDLFGYGIINADGELWKAQRKAGLRFLNTPNLKVLTDKTLPEYLKITSDSLKERGPEELVDLESTFHELTTQLMGQMAYDMDMHATDSFSVAFEYASGKTGERFQNPLWRVSEMFFGHKFRKSVREVKRFGADIVSNAVKARESKSTTADAVAGETVDSISGSLINSLLDLISDHQMVADAALNYLSAGRDTTAQALTWMFYLLMRHPQAVTKIRQEACSFLAADTSDLADLTPSALPYTMAVFYESLRLYPPVPFEIKQCNQLVTLPDATHLPRGTVVVWCPWAMNRSRATWGPNAHEFQPERWLTDPNDTAAARLVTRPPWEFPVFNGGPRTCLGKKMAEAITVMVAAALVCRFDFVDADNGKPRQSRNSLTLPMEGGLPCYVKQRTNM